MRHPSGVKSIPALSLNHAVQTAELDALAPDITLQEANIRLASETTELNRPDCQNISRKNDRWRKRDKGRYSRHRGFSRGQNGRNTQPERKQRVALDTG